MIKVKPHLCVEQLLVSDLVVYGASYHTRAVLSCDIRPHKQTPSDTISSTHSCGFPLLYNPTLQLSHDIMYLKTRIICDLIVRLAAERGHEFGGLRGECDRRDAQALVHAVQQRRPRHQVRLLQSDGPEAACHQHGGDLARQAGKHYLIYNQS